MSDPSGLWIPPFFTCGECGGEIGRWPMLNMLRQEILDWRHRSVPDAWQDTPHRAVLGTPVPDPVALAPGTPESDEEDLPDPVPPPEVPARAAMREELPPSALSLDKQAAENGWEVEAWYMRGPLMNARWKFVRMTSSVVLRLRRDGHRLVATWATDARGDWKFDGAWSLGHYVEPFSSPELKVAVNRPRMICETCQETIALHVSTNTGPVCFTDYQQREAP